MREDRHDTSPPRFSSIGNGRGRAAGAFAFRLGRYLSFAAGRIVVGFPPGTSSDICARLIGQWLSEKLGQQFVVENRPGAGTNIAAETVVQASPDGYSLLWVTQTNAINSTLYRSLKFNFLKDIEPVAGVITVPTVMMVNPQVPAKTVAEFIAYAKANPGKLNMSSPGIGSANHVLGELFQMMTGTKLTHVPYKGSQFPDLLSGQVQVTFNPLPSSMAFIKDGKLRALAVTADEASAGVAGCADRERIRARL